MWAKIRAKLREWFIVAIGVCLIAGGFFLASHQPSPSAAAFTAQDGKSPKAETAMQARQPAPPAAAKTVEQSHSSAATVITANIGQPVAKPSPGESHDHAMNQGMAAAAQTSTPPPANASGGDTGAGRLVFRKCQACHSLEPGKNILGPSLAGIIGRKAGSEPGYNYSPAMKQANFVWDAKTLDAYLSDPQKVVPGNKMPFPGLKTDHDRADVIAYLTAPAGASAAASPQQTPAAEQHAAAPTQQTPQGAASADSGYLLDAKYTLRTGIADGKNGLSRRRRRDRRQGQSRSSCGARRRRGRRSHLDQRRGRRTRHRVSRFSRGVAARHRLRRQRHLVLPCRGERLDRSNISAILPGHRRRRHGRSNIRVELAPAAAAAPEGVR